MKIILLQDVSNIGQKYDVKEVNNGFAQNFLIPQKLAVMATQGELERIEKMKKTVELEKKRQEELLMKDFNKIKNVVLSLKAKAADTGGLFSSIGKDKIITELKKQHNIDVDEDHIILDKPIKEVGEYDIAASIGDKKLKFKIKVEAED